MYTMGPVAGWANALRSVVREYKNDTRGAERGKLKKIILEKLRPTVLFML